MCFTSPELRSASSYGHFTVAKSFWSQCHILSFVWECGGPRADGVDLEVYFGVVLGFTFDLPHIYLRSTSSQPQVDLEVNLVGTRSQSLHTTNGTWPNEHKTNRNEHMATSRLSSVSIETCADEVDFQVDLRLTWGRPEANVLNVLVNTTSWLEVDLRLTWGRPPGLHRRH